MVGVPRHQAIVLTPPPQAARRASVGVVSKRPFPTVVLGATMSCQNKSARKLSSRFRQKPLPVLPRASDRVTPLHLVFDNPTDRLSFSWCFGEGEKIDKRVKEHYNRESARFKSPTS